VEYTPNLNLKKPDRTDLVLVDDLNYNMDILDQEVQDIRGVIDNTVQALDAHTETRAALNKLGHVYHAMLTVTLDTDDWTGSEAPFVQIQEVSGILADDAPIVDVVLSGDWEVDEARLEAWGYIYRIVTSNNFITAYAREKPNVALPLQLKVVR
jgi:hypothetical protein